MVEVWLPYGDTEVCLTLPTEVYLGTLDTKPIPKIVEVETAVKSALAAPINSSRLRELVKPGTKVAVAVDSFAGVAITQPMIQLLIEELSSGGVKYPDIILMAGWDYNKPLNREAAANLLGELPGEIQLNIHDPYRMEDFVEVAATSYRTRVFLEQAFLHADFHILVGSIGLHPYAGYSGGSQLVTSALSGIRTLHHNYILSLDPRAQAGNLEDNPVHLDLTEIASFGKVDYILNVVVDPKGQPLNAFSGDLNAAFAEGVKFLDALYRVQAEGEADILVVSPGGSPFDSSLSSAHECLFCASRIVREGGVIILVAECSKGYGNINFFRWADELRSPEDVKEALKKSFLYGIHSVAQLMKVLQRNRVIIVSALPESVVAGVFKFKAAKSVDDAVESAFRLVGKRSKVWAIPRAAFTLPTLKATTAKV